MHDGDRSTSDGAEEKIPPALRLLKSMWKIPEKKPAREMPPPAVVHDIYCVPEHKPLIPQRVAKSRHKRNPTQF